MIRAGMGLLAASILAFAGSPAAAGLPAWAKEIAAGAPDVPEGMPEWPSRVLLDETVYEIGRGGTPWQVRQRTAVQYLSNRVDDMVFGMFGFDDTTSLKKSKGWHLAPNERAKRNDGGAVDLTLPDAFVTDSKARVVALSDVKKGSLVFYEFVAEQTPRKLAASVGFGEAVPVDRARVVFALPAGWTLRHAWLRAPGDPPARTEEGWVFEVRGLVPPREEKLADAHLDVTPRLVVGFFPPEGEKPAVAAFPDWNEVGRWYRDLAKGRETGNAAIESAARQASPKADDGFFERVLASTSFVRDRVRYVAREVGIGGYQPRPATQVFSELVGDCKDKGTLLRAVLGAHGIRSYPILVNATQRDTVSPSVPDPGSFDHFVIGALVPEDETVPAEMSDSVAEVPGVGRLFVVDATDDAAWPGTLCASLAGKAGLVVADDRAVVVNLPEGTPAAHRVDRTAKAIARPDGSARVSLETRYRGAPAEEARRDYRLSSLDRRKRVERAALDIWIGGEVKSYRAEEESPAGEFVEILEVEIPKGAPAIANGISVFPGAGESIEKVSVTRRERDVVFEHPIGLSYTSTIEGLPPRPLAALPTSLEGDGWSVRARVEADGATIRGRWEVERSRRRFAPAAFPELKKFWSAASKAAGTLVAGPP